MKRISLIIAAMLCAATWLCADPGTADCAGFCCCVLKGDTESVRSAVESGFCPDTELCFGEDYTMPLMLAVSQGNVEMVRLLLSLGADANKVCSRGICPLMLTAANLSEPGYEEIKEALLQAGARSDENLLSAAETFVW